MHVHSIHQTSIIKEVTMLSRVEWTVDAPHWPAARPVAQIDVMWSHVGETCDPSRVVLTAEQAARRDGTATLRHCDGRVFACKVVAHA